MLFFFRAIYLKITKKKGVLREGQIRFFVDDSDCIVGDGTSLIKAHF